MSIPSPAIKGPGNLRTLCGRLPFIIVIIIHVSTCDDSMGEDPQKMTWHPKHGWLHPSRRKETLGGCLGGSQYRTPANYLSLHFPSLVYCSIHLFLLKLFKPYQCDRLSDLDSSTWSILTPPWYFSMKWCLVRVVMKFALPKGCLVIKLYFTIALAWWGWSRDNIFLIYDHMDIKTQVVLLLCRCLVAPLISSDNVFVLFNVQWEGVMRKCMT